MANVVYNRFTYNLMKKLVDLSTDVIKCGLLDDTHTPDPDHNVWTDVSGDEVVGAEYVAGGATVGGKTVTQDDANDKSVFDANDVVWANATITARYAILYDVTADSNLICLIDFTENKVTDNNDFNIMWHADGIFALAIKAA